MRLDSSACRASSRPRHLGARPVQLLSKLRAVSEASYISVSIFGWTLFLLHNNPKQRRYTSAVIMEPRAMLSCHRLTSGCDSGCLWRDFWTETLRVLMVDREISTPSRVQNPVLSNPIWLRTHSECESIRRIW